MTLVATKPLEAERTSAILPDGTEVAAFEVLCPICSTACTGLVVRESGKPTLNFNWDAGVFPISRRKYPTRCDHLYEREIYSLDDFEENCYFYFGGPEDSDDPRLQEWLAADGWN